jgi:hypothetical protein
MQHVLPKCCKNDKAFVKMGWREPLSILGVFENKYYIYSVIQTYQLEILYDYRVL